jgi:hypothetical protein
MWWTLFTLADLYIGLIVLDAMALSVPPEKVVRFGVVRKVLLALIVGSAIVFAIQVALRLGWIHL